MKRIENTSPARQAVAAAALAIALTSSAAYAQTDLTVYGNIDLGIVKESGSATRLDRGYNNWIGFKGREDLGGGWAATFNLQARFKPDTGEQERPLTFWQGETTVGLRNASVGSLRVGRALSPLWHDVWAYEPWLNSGFNASLAAYQTGRYSSDGVNDAALGFADFSRISNGVFYMTPELRGVRLHVASAVEKAVGASSRTHGAALNYASGPVAAMFSYERNAREDQIYFVGASYRMGPVTVMGSFAHDKPVDAERERNMVLAGTYDLDGDTIRGGYGRNQENKNNKLSLGYMHALSKRTSLYVDLYREKTTGRTRGLALGMNHVF